MDKTNNKILISFVDTFRRDTEDIEVSMLLARNSSRQKGLRLTVEGSDKEQEYFVQVTKHSIGNMNVEEWDSGDPRHKNSVEKINKKKFIEKFLGKLGSEFKNGNRFLDVSFTFSRRTEVSSVHQYEVLANEDIYRFLTNHVLTPVNRKELSEYRDELKKDYEALPREHREKISSTMNHRRISVNYLQ